MNYKDQAKKQSKLLLKKCSSLDKKEMARFEKRLKSYCKKRKFTNAYTKAILSHRYRYFLTIEKIREILNEKGYKNAKIGLEMGGDGPFTDLLTYYIPEIIWISTRGDLRDDWGVDENSLDLIPSTEVIEHLSDIPTGFQDTFYGSGLTRVLEESYKALKKDGLLFITTPNASSVNVIKNVIAGEAPWFFPLHIREYTKKELESKLRDFQFEILYSEAIHCMSYPLDIDWTSVFEVILSCGYDCSQRGDDLFIISKKVE